ncbi:MAG: DUF4381 family protein [candidate division Zixibacteria bacterium]|nr:DUF4381 family protein [candidate division Zixibacteria bacterium]
MILWASFAATAAAQSVSSDTLIVGARVDQERIRVGDPFLFAVSAGLPLGGAVEWPAQGNSLGPFEILELSRKGPISGAAGAVSDTLVYTLTAYTLGRLVIPALAVVCRTTGGTTAMAATDSIAIAVVSVIEDEATDIRDLKDPEEVPAVTPWYLWAALVAVIAVVALVVAYFLWRRKKPASPVAIPAVTVRKSPYETALEELDRLAETGLCARGAVKQHYTELADIARRYLGERYRIAAMEITTRELLAELDKTGLSFEQRHRIADLLATCDLVKFARHVPTVSHQEGSIDEARGIVAFATPEEKPAETPQSSEAIS